MARIRILAQRQYAVRRLAQLGHADTLDTLRGAMDDKDPEVAFCAAAGVAAHGNDPDALAPVLREVLARWDQVRPFLAEVFADRRSDDLSRWAVVSAERGEQTTDKMAALRLFRLVGTRTHAGRVVKFLDASEHQVKKEAINALRVAVEGQPAIENLSVFQAIEMAREMRKGRP